MFTGIRTDGVYWDYHEYDGFIKWTPRGTSPFSKKKGLTIGIEFESECYPTSDGEEKADFAYDITNAAGHPCVKDPDAIFIAARDGSLTRGIELITQPCTYDFHMTKINWKRALETVTEIGAIAHDGGNCGIHYHLNRSYFASNASGAEEAFTVLLQNNKQWLSKFSRRQNFEYCAFAEVDNEGSGQSVDKFWSYRLKTAEEITERQRIAELKNTNMGHHRAVNFGNFDTIELRFIRSTTTYDTFVASLQLIVMMAEIVKNFSLEQVCSVRLSYFMQLAKAKGFKEFYAYCCWRGIDPRIYM